MANEKNLLNGKKFKSDEQATRDAGRNGGIASGKAKREKRIIRDAILERMKESDWNTMIDNAIARALESDDCFKTLRDTLGQKPVDKVDATIDAVVIDVTLNEDEG